MKGVFMTRTGNVVNVDTVKTMTTIGNREDHPRARGHFGLSA
jgi:hypothetical protein